MATVSLRRGAARTRVLRALLRDTMAALQEVQDILTYDPEVPAKVQEIANLSSRPIALVILGSNPSARARLLNCILGKQLLPEDLPRGCRWLRIQYGSSTQVHLTLGNSEFEFVEDLECNRQPWDTLPVQDILRQENGDLATMLEIELNNSFLKDGIRIVMPPDIATDPGTATLATLKQLHSDLLSKRESILNSFNPVYLYALDSFGRDVFSNVWFSKMTPSRSEEDFWSTFNLYYMTRIGSEEKNVKTEEEVIKWNCKEGNESAVFTAENCLDLQQIKEIDANAQVFFFLFSDSKSIVQKRRVTCEATESTESVGTCVVEDLPESDQDLLQDRVCRHEDVSDETSEVRLREQQMAFMNDLLDQWELLTSGPQKQQARSEWALLHERPVRQGGAGGGGGGGARALSSRTALAAALIRFAALTTHYRLLELCTRLSEIHVKQLQQFILMSFELARELQVVPKKIHYVATHEEQLYQTINKKFFEGEKKQELVQMMQEVLDEMKKDVDTMDWSVDDLPWHQDKRFTMSNSIYYSSRTSPSVSIQMSEYLNRIPESNDIADQLSDTDRESPVEQGVSYDSYNFDDYEIVNMDESLVAESFAYRIHGMQCGQSVSTGGASLMEQTVLSRDSGLASRPWSCCSGLAVSTKQAGLDVQRAVLSKLSSKISLKLTKFMDCLKDSYFGTLERCLESLEQSVRSEVEARGAGGRAASVAARQLLAAPTHLRLPAHTSALRGLCDALRRLFYRLRLSSSGEEEACCALSPVWRRRAAHRTLASLTAARLARLVSAQMVERVNGAHAQFGRALAALEGALAARLLHSEDTKLAIRKTYAPLFARLCLESTSMCDLLMYGQPELGREIGRGQYGVVYAVRGSWAGRSPAAAKSVLPVDERHYHDLAMEFFYTRSIPAHPRVVGVWGSLVQRRGGGPPAVLLVCARWARDLHVAVKAGLTFHQRMVIAVDIVEGIRYLHSLGLVHRDIKLRNVLVDWSGRAALADLGFCGAGPLLAGSLVGTPLHMAPDLLRPGYGAPVDVYAFGVLFWYLCAGTVRLPGAFESFQNKEQLWSRVKRGLRPERLPCFSDECWDIMQSCWATEPGERMLLGELQPRLEAVLRDWRKHDLQSGHTDGADGNLCFDSVNDSLDMTGLHP